MIGGTAHWASTLNLLAFVVVFGLDFWTVRQQKSESEGDGGAASDANTFRFINIATGVALVGGAFGPKVLPGLNLPGTPVPYVVVGLSLAALGTLLRVWSIQTLGRYFKRVVVVQPSHVLIEDGPYKKLRHPGYTGALLALLGLALSFGNAVGLVLLVLPFAAYLARIGVEERAMADALGEPYQDWMRRTRRLVPFVW